MKKDSGIFEDFFLCKLSLKYNKNNIGLYHDDGLVIFKNITVPKSEKVKKDVQKLFKENELDIVIQCNMKTVNYLDVTLNLVLIALTKKKIIK